MRIFNSKPSISFNVGVRFPYYTARKCMEFVLESYYRKARVKNYTQNITGNLAIFKSAVGIQQLLHYSIRTKYHHKIKFLRIIKLLKSYQDKNRP